MSRLTYLQHTVSRPGRSCFPLLAGFLMAPLSPLPSTIARCFSRRVLRAHAGGVAGPNIGMSAVTVQEFPARPRFQKCRLSLSISTQMRTLPALRWLQRAAQARPRHGILISLPRQGICWPNLIEARDIAPTPPRGTTKVLRSLIPRPDALNLRAGNQSLTAFLRCKSGASRTLIGYHGRPMTSTIINSSFTRQCHHCR